MINSNCRFLNSQLLNIIKYLVPYKQYFNVQSRKEVLQKIFSWQSNAGAHSAWC